MIVGGVACSDAPGFSPSPADAYGIANVEREPAGANCAAGGLKVEYGADSDDSGILDPLEVTGTQYACNGRSCPVGGPATADELRKLADFPVAVADERAGENCANGGLRIDTGTDDNGNGHLDIAEVFATSYVCNSPACSDGDAGLDASIPDGSDAGADATADATADDGAVSDGAVSDGSADATLDSGTDAPVDLVTGFAYAPTVWSPGVMGQYAIHSDGRLTPLSPATVSIANDPTALAATPDAKFLYVTDSQSNAIEQFAIGANGAVSPLSPASLATAAYPAGIAVHPSGKFAYVTGNTDGVVTRYAVSAPDAGTPGTLTSLGTTQVGSGPTGVAVTPNGNTLYVVDGLDDKISQFSIDANGALTALSPATVATGFVPDRITVSASGQYAYVSHFDAIVGQYAIDVNGKLTALAPATVATEDTVDVLATNPAGTLAFAANKSVATVSQFAIANGALSPLIPPSISLQNDGGTVSLGDTAFDPSGSFVYVVDVTGNVIRPFSATPSGLTPLPSGAVASNPGGARLLVVAKP
jgi:6-phosphogluconolactonase (cycloisomerase 2 family)